MPADIPSITAPIHVNNYSAGGVFGVQAGVIGGSVQVTGPDQPAADHDIASLLTELQTMLASARSAGRLDADVYDAARQELDDAAEAIRDATAAGQGRAKLALKRLHGLVADLTDLAARVVTVIAAIRSMS